MRSRLKLTRGVLAMVALAGLAGSAAATENTTVFDRLYRLDATAADAQQRAGQLARQVETLDMELETRWGALDVATRAAKPIRKNVTQGLGRWLMAHRRAERDAMDGPHAGADTRRLLRYAAPRALPSRLKDVDVVRRADNERSDFVDAMERRAQWSVELARTTASAGAMTGSRDVLVKEARAGESQADIAATADELDAVLADIPPLDRPVDFHRLKGTLARPVTEAPRHRFNEQGALIRPSGWTYRVEQGTDVHAIEAGAVVYRGVVQGFGLIVVIDHGAGYKSVYAHLRSTAVEVGDDVARADVFAAVGDSGSLDGSRLFFELRKAGNPIDPQGWFLK